jgi:branched-chain amino acid aminotransferase/para-aminobenzoate synthetase component 1
VSENRVWLNGEMLPIGQARISPLDRGLLYGDGLFETLRAQDGKPLHLLEHLARLAVSGQAMNLDLPPALAWERIMSDLLAANGLARGAAKLKIILTRGEAEGLGLPPSPSPTLLIMAQTYQPPSDQEYERGWRALIADQGYAPPLAQHKSLNYLCYLCARQRAKERGADEAVILGPRGEVCEAAAGSLLVMDNRGWWTPQSPWRLRGVTLGLAREMLAARGLVVSDRQAIPQDLQQAEALWVLGSLMGVMPVAELDGLALPQTQAGLAEEIRGQLLA